MKELLDGKPVELLTKIYLEEYTYDSRLPELFCLIDENNLIDWFIDQFESDYSISEMKKLLKEYE